jgi:outer membrane protein assembly factor BamB
MRRSAVLLLCSAAALTACSPSTATDDTSTTAPASSSTAESTTTVDDVTARCTFDYRSQLSLLDPVSGNLRWTTDIMENDRFAPLLMHGTAYSTTVGSVEAVDIATGDVVWTWTVSDDDYSRGTVATDDVIAVLTSSRLVGLDPVTGTERWERPNDSEFVAVASGSAGPELAAVPRTDDVLPLFDDGQVIVLDPLTGAERWRADAPKDWSFGPWVQGDLVLQPTFEGAITAYDIATGAQRWQWRTRPGVGVRPTWSGDERTIVVTTTGYLGNPDGITPPADADQLIGLDLETGAPRWAAPLPADVPWWSAVTVDDAMAISGLPLGDGSYEMRTIDIPTGATRWSFPTGFSYVPKVNPLGDGFMLATQSPPSESTGTPESWAWVALGTDGVPRWLASSPREARFVLEFQGATLVAASVARTVEAIDAVENGAVMAIDPNTGAIQWSTPLRDAVRWLGASDEGVVVFSSDDGVFCD